MSRPREVNARNLAIAAGAVVAIYVVVLFTQSRVPDRIVRLVGGPTGVARWGGVVATTRDASGSIATVELPEVAESAAPDAIDALSGGGLTFHVVRSSHYAFDIGDVSARDVKLDIDHWHPEDGGPGRNVGYLYAPHRADLEAVIAGARARGALHIPDDSMIAFERIRRSPNEGMWRTYELAARPDIDASMIDSAIGSYDPETTRPVVLLDFTGEGARRFADLTERIVGDKLAIVIGKRVYSAPVINTRIGGGRASIAMGTGDAATLEAERDALVAVLGQPDRPEATVIDWHWQAPDPAPASVWLARLVLGFVTGLVMAVVAFAVVRIARPRWYARPHVEGPVPWKRWLVTLAAPLAMFALPQLTLPFVNDIELRHIIYSYGRGNWMDRTSMSVIAIGVMPILTSFCLVELVALAVPRLRWRRHDPRGRIGLGRATAYTAVVVALVQGFFVARYLENLGRGVGVVDSTGWWFRIVTMASLAAGTALLATIAGMIREHGLGNGYGALLVAAPVMLFLARLDDDPDLLVHAYTTLAAIVAIALVTACVLRWRIGGNERQPELRVPTSAIAGASPLGGIGYVIGVIVALPLYIAWPDVVLRVFNLQSSRWVTYASFVVFVPVWSWMFARPAVIARVALQANLQRPSLGMWARATLVSVVATVVPAVIARSGSRDALWTLGSAVMTMLGTAVVLDIIDDARVRRARLAVAGVVHQVQYLGVIEHVLGEASISCHFHASNLRTLLAFFGPWAPVIVLVPEAQAALARDKFDGVVRAANSEVPVVEAAS
jgi:hypothetical protein